MTITGPEWAIDDVPEGVVHEVQDGLRMVELGQTGLRRWSGYVNEEFLKHLEGTNGVKVYREMRDNDPVIGAMSQAIDTLIRQVEWRVERPGKEDDERADFIEECMQDMSHTWDDFVSEVMSMLTYGWSYFEIVYKMRQGYQQADGRRRSQHDDNKIGWRKFSLRSQDTLQRWVFDEHGGVRGMIQYAIPTNQLVFIPIEKALLFRTSSHKGNPEGRSMLRNAYRPWFMKKRIEEIEAIGVERDLAGLPVAHVPAEILDPANHSNPRIKAIYDRMVRVTTQVRRDQVEGMLFPRSYDAQGNLEYEFSLLASSGSRQFPTDAIITRYDQRIAMTVLADFVLLGHDKVGSFALSSDKTDIFVLTLGSILKSIAEVINRHAVTRLLEVNGMDLEDPPIIVPGDIETPNLTEQADFITKLAAAGMPMFPDPELEKHLRSIAKLPEPTDEAIAHREEMVALQQEQDMVGAEAGIQQTLQMQQADFGEPQEEGSTEEEPPEEEE